MATIQKVTHTPGPWQRRGAGPNSARDIWAGNVNVAWALANTETEKDCPDLEQSFANARLITAAPELLEELEMAIPLLMQLCSVALTKEVNGYLPHGLWERIHIWLSTSQAQTLIRQAKGE